MQVTKYFTDYTFLPTFLAQFFTLKLFDHVCIDNDLLK